MHNEAVNRLDFITGREPIKVDYEPGTVEIVEQHDGSKIALRKLNSEYDIHDKLAAMSFLLNHAAEGQIVTGLLYVDSDPDDLHAPSRDRRDAAQRARREGAVPRLGDAGEVQREFAVTHAWPRPADASSSPRASRASSARSGTDCAHRRGRAVSSAGRTPSRRPRRTTASRIDGIFRSSTASLGRPTCSHRAFAIIASSDGSIFDVERLAGFQHALARLERIARPARKRATRQILRVGTRLHEWRFRHGAARDGARRDLLDRRRSTQTLGQFARHPPVPFDRPGCRTKRRERRPFDHDRAGSRSTSKGSNRRCCVARNACCADALSTRSYSSTVRVLSPARHRSGRVVTILAALRIPR